MAKDSGRDVSDVILAIQDELYNVALARGVLCCKGSFFDACEEQSKLFIRMTFVTTSKTQIVKAIMRFGEAVKIVFK